MEITEYEYEFLKSIVNRYETKYALGRIESMTIKDYYVSENSGMSLRLYTCLLYNHIYRGDVKIDLKTMGQLKSLSKKDFMRLKQFGKVRMFEVEQLFNSFGWELRS